MEIIQKELVKFVILLVQHVMHQVHQHVKHAQEIDTYI